MTKVLVVDDEESIRNLMRMTLELDGYEVLLAQDGPTGLKMFEKESPDVVLLDVRLPGMGGIEVLTRIKALDPDSEVIIVTGHGDMEMATECLRREASNFLTKPISEEVLSLSLKRSLEKVALKRKVKQYTTNLEAMVREANFELEEAYQFRENLIDKSPDAIISIRKGGSIIIFNSAAEKLLGYDKAEVIGKMNIVDIYPRGEARRIMRDLKSDDFGGPGVLEKREIVIVDKYGKEIPVCLSASLLYQGGQETGSVGIFTDLREIRSLEKQLIRTLQLMENLIENSPSPTIYVKKGGEIVVFNAAAEKLTGYRKEEVIGKLDVRDLYRPGEAKQIMKDFRSSSFGRPGILEKDMVWLDRNRVEIPIRLYGAILYEDGKEVGSLGIVTDQREKKALESQLLRSEKLASLGQLAAGIAHEINQPLTGVLTFAHLLKRKFQSDEQTHKDLEVIVRETTRIREIVKGVLDFARETPMEKEPRHIEQVLDQTLEIVIRQHKFFGITLNKEYDPSVPEVVVDSNMMQQVFMNIILNALDAMKGAGTLTVRTRKRYDWIEVELGDTGCGMPEEILDKIFDPFFTTKASTEGTGMGLGLAVTYGIVKNHNGDITVSSKVGSGTTFTVRLPINSENPL
ncbi:MAG TPA: PAS domain S-box protein [Desulfomonilaceae bacterium]|nr:PAS domain S-box protein [Desulfomonilaceae bacterium]